MKWGQIMATNNKSYANSLIKGSKSVQVYELSKFIDKKAILKQIEKDINKSEFVIIGA